MQLQGFNLQELSTFWNNFTRKVLNHLAEMRVRLHLMHQMWEGYKTGEILVFYFWESFSTCLNSVLILSCALQCNLFFTKCNIESVYMIYVHITFIHSFSLVSFFILSFDDGEMDLEEENCLFLCFYFEGLHSIIPFWNRASSLCDRTELASAS